MRLTAMVHPRHCDECGELRTHMASFLVKPHPDGITANLCRECLYRAHFMIEHAATAKEALPVPDLDKCPSCGGPADNGHDRCYPPNPYVCSKCGDMG